MAICLFQVEEEKPAPEVISVTLQKGNKGLGLSIVAAKVCAITVAQFRPIQDLLSFLAYLFTSSLTVFDGSLHSLNQSHLDLNVASLFQLFILLLINLFNFRWLFRFIFIFPVFFCKLSALY